MKPLLLTLSLLLISLPSVGQSSERPETIVVPVSVIGEVSDSRKQILQNTLDDKLKEHFRLIPQDQFERVQDKVFEELDYEECTEDQCIVMIQEMLQVENLFHLQVISDEGDTQLSLKWVNLDEKRVEEDFCEECKTRELRKRVGGLVDELVGVKKVVKEKVVKKLNKTNPKGLLYQGFRNGKLGWFKDKLKYHWTYVGEIKNDLPNGFGELKNYHGIYKGYWESGKYHGDGEFIFNNGSIYKGKWKNGFYDGYGRFSLNNGSYFIGDWKENREWNITKFDSNGEIIKKWVQGEKINN